MPPNHPRTGSERSETAMVLLLSRCKQAHDRVYPDPYPINAALPDTYEPTPMFSSDLITTAALVGATHEATRRLLALWGRGRLVSDELRKAVEPMTLRLPKRQEWDNLHHPEEQQEPQRATHARSRGGPVRSRTTPIRGA
jgi:hypothetical protein